MHTNHDLHTAYLNHEYNIMLTFLRFDTNHDIIILG